MTQETDYSQLPARIRALRKVGVPYPEGLETVAEEQAKAQAAGIVERLKADQIETESDREIIALIAYLQRLGTDIKAGSTNAPAPAPNPDGTTAMR